LNIGAATQRLGDSHGTVGVIVDLTVHRDQYHRGVACEFLRVFAPFVLGKTAHLLDQAPRIKAQRKLVEFAFQSHDSTHVRSDRAGSRSHRVSGPSVTRHAMVARTQHLEAAESQPDQLIQVEIHYPEHFARLELI
jgi:hypothetical protein